MKSYSTVFASAAACMISLLGAAEPTPAPAWATNLYNCQSIQVGNDGSMYLGAANAVWKLDKRGTPIWAHEIWGTGPDLQGFRHGLHVGADESIYLTGAFDGSVTIGEIALTNGGSQLFLAKFNRDGGVIWAKQTGHEQSEYGQDIGTDAAGNVYVTGLSMGSEPPSSNPYDCEFHFLNKYDRDGNFVWHRRSLLCQFFGASRLAVDPIGNSFVSAVYNSVYPFGISNSTSSSRIEQPFLAKYDTHGNVAWLKHVGSTNSTGDSYVTDVTSDGCGNLYICGFHDHMFSLGNTNLITTTNTRAFLAKYSPQGHLLHAVQSSGNGDARAYSIAVDSTGNQYIVGPFSDFLGFAGTNLTEQGGTYFAKFDANGNTIWLYQATNAPFFTALAVDPAQNIYAAGFSYPYSGGYAVKFHTTAPPLRFSSSPNSVLLSWSVLADDFMLEAADSAAGGAIWTAVPTNRIATTTVSNSVTFLFNFERQFFRLRRPQEVFSTNFQ